MSKPVIVSSLLRHPMHTCLRRFVLYLAFTMLAGTGVGAAAAQQLPTMRLTAGIHVITAEVAADDQARMRGLMFRRELAPNHGMLFTYTQPGIHCMWMKNTFIPLSVAFLEADGTIINIEDMQPHDERSHCAKRPAHFALEMTQGWFSQRGVTAGMKLGKLPATERK